MKVNFYAKRMVQINMTRRQFESMRDALDSLMEHIAQTESCAYDDCKILEKILNTETYRAKVRSGEMEPMKTPSRGY
jgi:hypothetical protein